MTAYASLWDFDNEPSVAIQRLPHGEGLDLPAYATAHSAGMDIMAAIAEPVTLQPGARQLIPAGFAMALPARWEAQIRPRSGLALKNGVTVLNSPGTIDADYRGEVQVLLINHGAEAFTITRGMRIAQMIVSPVMHISWDVVDSLETSERGAGGFGSTGV
jgi:dUTP pyrophosphatase